ncbi:MAG: HesA/MoeB/ThiF family protein [Acutalibacteraceae bacterium]
MNFTDEQLSRYSRNILLDGIGKNGQEKLLNAKVLVIGAGGLGSPVCMYLAAAGVGTIGIADNDEVDLSNLQRQIMHNTSNLGVSKVVSAQKTLADMNPDVNIITYKTMINADNINEIIRDYDFIVDACDNFPTKFLINDACVIAKKPFVHGGVVGYNGQLMTYVPNMDCPCYRCIFENVPKKDSVPHSSQVGILGANAGVIGSLQAFEAIKYIIGTGELMTGKMLTFDGLTMKFRTVPFKHKSPDCKVCSENAVIKDVSQSKTEYCD